MLIIDYGAALDTRDIWSQSSNALYDDQSQLMGNFEIYTSSHSVPFHEASASGLSNR
jgi:hypothetical protein